MGSLPIRPNVPGRRIMVIRRQMRVSKPLPQWVNYCYYSLTHWCKMESLSHYSVALIKSSVLSYGLNGKRNKYTIDTIKKETQT
jgi:hypothetical protein